MQKFQELSVAQILREIDFGEPRGSKTGVFAILRVLKFANLVDLNLQKLQKFMKIKIRASQCVKMADFGLQESPTSISRKIQNL